MQKSYRIPLYTWYNGHLAVISNVEGFEMNKKMAHRIEIEPLYRSLYIYRIFLKFKKMYKRSQILLDAEEVYRKIKLLCNLG